jgi:hypothetical protein
MDDQLNKDQIMNLILADKIKNLEFTNASLQAENELLHRSAEELQMKLNVFEAKKHEEMRNEDERE